MIKTKYDLCADSVTLDYEELVATARVAVRYSYQALQERLRKWSQVPLKSFPTDLDASWLLDDAQALATATTSLHYLIEGRSREEVIVKRDETNSTNSE